MSDDKENNREKGRKCTKCAKSAAADNVQLFRFPKPSVRNLLRCTLWAKYLVPSDEQHSSVAFQKKLYNQHVVLCQNHFAEQDFRDNTKKALKFTAVPCDTERVIPMLPAYFEEPKAGPSQVEVAGPSKVTPPIAGPSKVTPSIPAQRIPLMEIGNTGEQKHAQGLEKLKTEKERKSYNKCVKYMIKVCQMRKRLKKMKNKVIVNSLTDSNALQKLCKKLTPTFALLLQSQLKNSSKKSKGRRWSKEDKIVALRLYKRSPTGYKLMRRLFNLPSPSTLKALLNRVPFSVGVTQSILQVLNKFTQLQQPADNNYILMFDEMSLKKHLNYNQKEDIIEGYQDHGTQGRTSNVACYALVFMIGGIRKAVKQPIAHYFSSGFSTADRLAVLLKEILHQCFEAGINITATVCDMDGVNRRALSILGATVEHPYFIVDNKEVVALYDAPHLLKCFRNLFMKYDIDCDTDISSGGKVGRGVAKWSHIKKFYELDNNNPSFVFAPALTKEHLNPNSKQKMRVKLAAQVLSHTVTAGLYAKISDGALSTDVAVTASVTSAMDKLFDCLNSDTADLRRGKLHATNMSSKSPHVEQFSVMKKFFKTMKFLGCQRTPPSQDGWIWTINGVERLFKQLVDVYHVRSLATRRLQQDPLENLFGCIRGNCGSNTNPTTGQFVAGLKTSIISNLSRIGTTGNCESDNNVVMSNFDTLLSASHKKTDAVSDTSSVIVSAEGNAFSLLLQDDFEEDSPEIQACAYVCGFLLKKMPTMSCKICRKIFVASNVSQSHTFVECREYNQFKNSLNYATKNMIACVESCASITNSFLNENGHKINLKIKVKDIILHTVNFDFINQCSMHGAQNIDMLLNSIFIICVKRFCVVKNRLFADEASAAALKRKMKIILHK